MPAHIARPEYVDRPTPERFTGEEVKDAETIELMRVAGRLAAERGVARAKAHSAAARYFVVDMAPGTLPGD